MSQTTVSAEIVEPYAEALMSLAQSQNLTDQIGQDVSSLLGLLRESDDLRRFLASPLIKAEAKQAVLRQVAAEQHPYVLNFLMLLVDRRRILFLEGICKQYQALLRKLNRTVLAEVISTVDLTQEQQQTITQKVQQMTGAERIELETTINSDLIGGVIIKVGSQVLDASIRGQLRRITNSLMRTAT